MNKKYIGLDLGTTTLGISYSDSLGFVHGKETFRFPKNQYVLARKRVYQLCDDLEIYDLVIGLPLHLNGNESEMSQNCRIFAQNLMEENSKIKIEFCDERMSTVSAHNQINELGFNHDKRKQNVDKIAACIILDTFLRMKENKNGK